MTPRGPTATGGKPASRTRRLPAEHRRRQLLSVALDLFGTRGYHATSMEDIAERAGVTKPVLYQHFPSKSELYRELVESVGNELLDAVTSDAQTESAPFARVLAGFRAYFRFVGEQTAAFRLLFGGGARQSDEFAEAVARVERSIAESIASLIEVDIDQEHRDLLGYAIVGLAEVTSRQWVLRREERERTAAADPAVPGASDDRPERAEGDLLAQRLADLVWAGLRALPLEGGRRSRPRRPPPRLRGP